MTTDIRVLYVDDDPDIRKVALMSLALDKGVDARAAASAEEALRVLEAGDWRPDVLLLDVMMPGMTGPELNAAIRDSSRSSKPAVIFVTARARDVDIESYRASNVAGVIVKPFDPVAFAGRVRAMLEARSS